MNSIANVARQSLLSILCLGAIGVLVNATISAPKKSTLQMPSAFEFPLNLPLADAKMLASKQVAPHTFKNKMVANGMSYRYQQDSKPIDIEIRYIPDGVANRPSMDAMLPVFSQIPATVLQPSTMKEISGLGFYSLFVEKKTAYFGTCINPQGMTTVTGDQFHNNSNPNPLSKGIPVDRLLPWILGRQTLRDSRCLWTVLSTPIDAATPDATMKILETVGVRWIRWWQAHFPPA
jgi:cyanosortase A-associated protein